MPVVRSVTRPGPSVRGVCLCIQSVSEVRRRCLELQWVSISRLVRDEQPRGCTDTPQHVATCCRYDPTGRGHYEGMYVLLQLCRWARNTVLPNWSGGVSQEKYGYCCPVPYFPPSVLGKFIPDDFLGIGDMATDTRKVILGAVLLAISTVLILGTGAIDIGIPAAAGALAALGLAAGALLVGTSEDGRPV